MKTFIGILGLLYIVVGGFVSVYAGSHDIFLSSSERNVWSALRLAWALLVNAFLFFALILVCVCEAINGNVSLYVLLLLDGDMTATQIALTAVSDLVFFPVMLGFAALYFNVIFGKHGDTTFTK